MEAVILQNIETCRDNIIIRRTCCSISYKTGMELSKIYSLKNVEENRPV